MKDCIGIVLARTGSRRIKNKNFLKLKKNLSLNIQYLKQLRVIKLAK